MRLSPQGLNQLLASTSAALQTPEGQKLSAILSRSKSCKEAKVRVAASARMATKDPALPYDGRRLKILHESLRFAASGGREPTTLNAAQRRSALQIFNVHPSTPAAVVAQISKETQAILPVPAQKLASDLHRAKKHVEELKSLSKSHDADVRIRAQKELPAALRDLARLVVAAKVKHVEAMSGFRRYNEIQVPEAQRKARMSNVKKQLRVQQKELSATKRHVKRLKPGALRNSYLTKAQATSAQVKVLKHRYTMLRHGRDLVRVRKIASGPIPRKPLPQSSDSQYDITPTTARIMIRYLAARIPRHNGEGRKHFIFRLRMYFKRALARYLRLREQGEAEAAAAESASVMTVVDDGPALESEVCAGGEARDNAADAMENIANSYTKDLELAATQLAPETAAHSGAGEFINPSVASELSASAQEASDPNLAIAQATTSEAELMQAFDTTPPSDEVFTLSDVTASGEMTTKPQWYKNKYLLGGAALAAIIASR